MAEIVLSPLLRSIITSIGSALGSELNKEIGVVWGVEEELKRLSSTLLAIHSLMADAEEKQLQSNTITDWLKKLKDAAFDAEDVVEDFNLEALQAKQVGDIVESKIRKVVRYLCSCFFLKEVMFRHEIGNRIQDIRKRLDEIAKEHTQFHLSEKSVARPIQTRGGPYRGPLIDQTTVIGREEETDKLIKELLMSNKSVGEKHFSVITIQGIGGLGKTTLARFVYDNEEVNQHFEVRGWVCASDRFESTRVTKEIVDSITGYPCEVTHPEVHLKKLIDRKRFLIVIDDVWEDALKSWDHFHIPFIYGNQGSKLIVTTRSEKVSLVMGTSVSFRLVGLPYQDCFKLFLRKAFVNGDEEIYPHLVDIGEDIVKKCGGVPLAINTLGGLLTFTRNESEWDGVLESSFWKLPQNEDSILPALRLSYHHLPPKVKPCFTFCSLFPKDWIFEKDVLIRMWMAQGYIQQDEWREEENVGETYFNDLLMRSFFSRDPKDENKFTMHDLVHDLAESLAKEECIRLHDGKLDLIPEKNNITQRVRHASLILSKNAKKGIFDDLKSLRRLRTLVALTDIFRYDDNPVKFNLIDTRKLKYLHMMYLRKGVIHRLPNVIGCFPLLRYLDLSRCEIEELPDSICSLSYLQTLNLEGCYELKKMPNNTASLKNLRYLNINGCFRMTYMPTHFEKLTNLRELTRFIVGKEAGKKIVELKGLNRLKGEIDIEGLDNVVDGEEAKEAGLKNKQLCKLGLIWSDDELRDVSIDEDVLENLQPHINLEVLWLSNFQGTYLPSWLSNLRSLRYLTLIGCSKLASLPEDLGKLKFLWLYGCHNISSLPRSGLPKSLESFHIDDSALLIESCERIKGRDWAKIAHIPDIKISSDLIYNRIFNRIMDSSYKFEELLAMV